MLQVHHKLQLALQDFPILTSPDDLAVVCANCHAIIHSDSKKAMSIEVLKGIWSNSRELATSEGATLPKQNG